MQVLPRPPHRSDVGPGLDGDIILDGEQVQGTGQVGVVGALKVVAHGRSELP